MAFRGGDTETAMRLIRGKTSVRRADEITFLYKVWFIHIFNRAFLFADGDGKILQADGMAFETDDDGFQDAVVHFVQTVRIDVQHGEGLVGNVRRNDGLFFDLREIADPFDEIVGDTRRASGALRNDFKTAWFRLKTKNLRSPFEDSRELFRVVVVKTAGHRET